MVFLPKRSVPVFAGVISLLLCRKLTKSVACCVSLHSCSLHLCRCTLAPCRGVLFSLSTSVLAWCLPPPGRRGPSHAGVWWRSCKWPMAGWQAGYMGGLAGKGGLCQSLCQAGAVWEAPGPAAGRGHRATCVRGSLGEIYINYVRKCIGYRRAYYSFIQTSRQTYKHAKMT